MTKSERRVELLFTLALLIFSIWYAIRMAMYSNYAGRVPAVVGLIMAVALVVQLVRQLAIRPGQKEEHHETAAVELAEQLPGGVGEGVQEAVDEVVETEDDNHQTLFALSPDRRRKLLAIVAYTLLFWIGSMAVGFVITTGVLIFAILLYSRERLWVALAWALGMAFATYWFVVGLLSANPWSGWIFG